MAKFELLIAANDEADLATGHKRKKEGDIVAVRPHPWNWGRKEIDNYLVVIIESNMTIRELRTMCEESLLRKKSDGTIITRTAFSILEQDGGANIDDYEKYSKRACKIDLADLKAEVPDLDLDKVHDRNLKYQPFKSAKQLVHKFSDIKEADVDTVSSMAGKDHEFSIDMQTKSLVYNKMLDRKEVLSKGVTRGIK